jgi:hypothetical protein
MRRLIAVAAAVAATVASGTLAPANADSPAAAGFTCGLTAVDDPGVASAASSGAARQPGQQDGEEDGGPVVIADLPTIGADSPRRDWDVTGNPASGTITCAVQVGGTGVYTDADAASASASGTVVVYLPPTLVSFFAAPTDAVWSCTTWTLTDAHGDSETLYLDDTTGEFLTDPAAATCALVITAETPPPPV